VKNVIGVGDSENDLCLVRESGIGIAFCSGNSYLNLVADIKIEEKSFRRLLEISY
jgi:phosphoserine phosphatase